MSGSQHPYPVIMSADNVNNDISGGRRGATLLIFVDDRPTRETVTLGVLARGL